MNTNDIEVGDIVRIGKGKVLWRVDKIRAFIDNGILYAELVALDGYAQTSMALQRLNVVTKAPW